MVYDAIRKGIYKFVSVELLGDVQADTRVIPWVLDAVALLGADPPAVGNLKDLQQLTMARGSGLQGRVRVAFTRDTSTGGHRPDMADKPNDDIAALMARLDKLEKEKTDLELKAAERESFERKLKDLETSTRNDKITAHRAKVVELFEAAIKDKRIVPAVRERFKRAYKLDTDAIFEVPLTDVETFIKENPNPDAPRKVTGLSGVDGEIPADARPDDKLVHLSRKFLRDNSTDPRFASKPYWQQLQLASHVVMRADPELGQDYKYMPATVAAAAGGN